MLRFLYQFHCQQDKHRKQKLFRQPGRKEAVMDIDQVLTNVGECGPYQLQMYNLYGVLAVSIAFTHLMQVFTGGSSEYWCAVPISDAQSNVSEFVVNDYTNWDTLIPVDDPNTQVNEHQCMQYSNYENISSATPLTDCNQGYVFDHSRYTRTIQEDFLLVCNNKVKTALAQSIYFTGVLVGSFVFGSIADWIGRKPTLIICVVMQSVLGTATAFVGSFEMYVLLRFITATAAIGIVLAGFTMASELAGVKRRTLIATVNYYYWSSGIMLLSLVAYFIRDWRTLQIVLSVPAAFTLLYLPFLPESPRWLLSQGSVKQAENTLRKLAKNKSSTLPQHGFLVSKNEESESKGKRQHTVVDLFRYPKLRMYTLNLMFNWFVIVMVYYAISISTSSLGIDPYIAFMINGLLEFPAHSLALILINRYGRRPILCMMMSVSTVACFTTGFIKPGVSLVTVVMLGKFVVTVAFDVVYIFSAEIFPTPVRSAGMGVASMCGRLGSVVSPLAWLLSEWWQPLPRMIFSFLSLLCCLVCLLLPETIGQKLPQMIDAREAINRTQATEMTTAANIATEI